ncbi:MbtH domain protein [Aliikangiella marina]|uniref:MbtH domain protein n=1 Tax=Aliikangiella marina TaxID=1712262 RepID=A0A545TJI8_9GAMM|nr:MbtH domain protein [Aliikangiella marina]TQV77390.1 MbtH domain protein [Aliikangiella marina]
MNELVKKLSQGQHKIVAERSDSAQELKEQIEREFVLLKFTETQGGTELGSQLDMQQSKLDDADFENAKGVVHLVGNLVLDYVPVQLVADIDLSTLQGTGKLVPVEEEATA